MDAKILDTLSENGSTCYLSSIELGEYIKNIPEDYDSYEVQRGFVKNKYLDNLISTVLLKRHIPPIVLVIENGKYNVVGEKLVISTFKILDGLQRTFRLKIIYETVSLFKNLIEEDPDILELTKFQISKRFKEELEVIGSSSAMLVKIRDSYKTIFDSDINRLNLIFNRFQWLEIWANLTLEGEVNKMLVLNAGHKPVKTQHQLELLYRYILDLLAKTDFREFSLVKEKEVSSTQYSKNRQLGQFHFSHLITSILSFSEGRTLTTNVDLVLKTQSAYFSDDLYDKFLNLEFLKKFVEFLLALDKALYEKYPDIAIRWVGRETSLVGLFAAAGQYAKRHEITPEGALNLLESKIVAHPESLNLDTFDEARRKVELAKVNIGNINKRAVFEGVNDILESRETVIRWESYF